MQLVNGRNENNGRRVSDQSQPGGATFHAARQSFPRPFQTERQLALLPGREPGTSPVSLPVGPFLPEERISRPPGRPPCSSKQARISFLPAHNGCSSGDASGICMSKPGTEVVGFGVVQSACRIHPSRECASREVFLGCHCDLL